MKVIVEGIEYQFSVREWDNVKEYLDYIQKENKVKLDIRLEIESIKEHYYLSNKNNMNRDTILGLDQRNSEESC